MAKDPKQMSFEELAQEMCKREDSLEHLTAKAEIMRRQTLAQIEAAQATAANARWTLVAAICAAISAVAAAVSAYLSFARP